MSATAPKRVGMVEVGTASGTTYQIDWDEARLRRSPRSTEPPGDEFDSVDLRRDGEWLSILKVVRLEVGAPACFVLEPLGDRRWVYATTRTTTPVQSIVPVRAGG